MTAAQKRPGTGFRSFGTNECWCQTASVSGGNPAEQEYELLGHSVMYLQENKRHKKNRMGEGDLTRAVGRSV